LERGFRVSCEPWKTSRACGNSSTDLTTEPMSSPKIIPLREITAPLPSGELLSLGQACARRGARERYIYAATHRHWLHTVQVGGWQKYLSWEVDALGGWITNRGWDLAAALNSGERPPTLGAVIYRWSCGVD